MPLFRLLLIALVAEQICPASAKELVRTYTNSEHNYRFIYPASWHVSVVPVKAGPVLYNYDPSLAMGQGLFPAGGAEIFVLPAADLTVTDRGRSPQELANENVRRFAHGKAVVEAITSPGNPDIRDVVRTAYDYQRIDDEDLQRDVTFYFRFDGRPFALGLNYWKNDPKAVSYEQILRAILGSIRRVAAKPN